MCVCYLFGSLMLIVYLFSLCFLFLDTKAALENMKSDWEVTGMDQKFARSPTHTFSLFLCVRVPVSFVDVCALCVLGVLLCVVCVVCVVCGRSSCFSLLLAGVWCCSGSTPVRLGFWALR